MMSGHGGRILAGLASWSLMEGAWEPTTHRDLWGLASDAAELIGADLSISFDDRTRWPEELLDHPTQTGTSADRLPAVGTERWCEIMTGSLGEQVRDVVARPGADVLAGLRESRLLPAADDQETRVLAAEDLAFDREQRTAHVHIDPQRPHNTDPTGATLYAGECHLNAFASEPFMRFSRLSEPIPFLILNFFGLDPDTRHTAVVDMQLVSAGGSVDISATNNPARSVVTHGSTDGARVSVPVALTTDPGGGALLLLQLDDQAEFDWFGADIF